MRALFSEAILAPSSGNLQPFQMHWLRDPTLKAAVASACNGQRAAVSSSTLVVVAASPRLALSTADQQLANIDNSNALTEESKAYHRKQQITFRRVLGLGSWAVWTPLVFLAGLLKPSLSLLPIGPIGGRHWAARNATFAAQTLMLAAAARGIDSCPMEGFSASKIVDLLGLSRGTVIPMVIAFGYRAEDARIESQWRRKISDVVTEY